MNSFERIGLAKLAEETVQRLSEAACLDHARDVLLVDSCARAVDAVGKMAAEVERWARGQGER